MTSERASIKAPEPGSTGAAPPDARIAEIAHWLGQLSRTLKTCRLYDARNPNAIRFREELGAQLVALLEKHGTFRLDFGAREIACDGHPLMSAQSREDNLAMPFYRDGLHALTFMPGTEPRELDLLLDLVLQVTGRARNGAEDLVTLLWDADLQHIGMSYVSSETDADLADEGGEPSADGTETARGPLLPWPGSSSGPEASPPIAAGIPPDMADAHGAARGAEASAAAAELRSEDWLAGEPGHELEHAFEELDATSATDLEQFAADMRTDRATGLAGAAIALIRDTLHSGPLPEDRDDLVDLLERVLHDAISRASWPDARDAVDGLTECTEGNWDASGLVQELAHPESVVTAALVRHLDEHALAELHEFIGFARSLGAAAIEWLMGIVAIANHQRTRRTLVRALVELCEGNPERLAPWLSDPRWYVVRNAVLVVGSAGGAPVGMFRPLLRHPELRVRQEVVTALAKADPDAALPLLLEVIQDPDIAVRGPALHQLGTRRNPQAADALLKLVVEPGFRKRPDDEVRSVLSALGGCAGDDALPRLEEQLVVPGGFLGGGNAGSAYAHAVARCIARIGTPAAVELLQRGSRSRAAATRDACRLALQGTGHA